MPTTLTTTAVEESTFVIGASFTDDGGAAVVPDSGLTWSLYKKVSGAVTVVNGRQNVAIASAATVTIVLSGDDLAIVDGQSTTRYLTIEGTYDSDAGSNLPIKDELTFSIAKLVGVS